MDPNETLRLIREDIEKIRNARHAGSKAHHVDQLVEHVEALDGWLSKGGFLPAPWVWGR